MSDALQIRHCRDALQAKHSYSLPSFLQAPPARRPISNNSNREKEPSFFGPSRGGSFLSDPPAVRPRFSRGIPQQEIQIQQPSRLKNSNPEALRLETAVTQTKQTTPTRSNRELERCFSPSKFDPRRGAGSLRPRVGIWFTGRADSNREDFRLETTVSARKYGTETESNREYNACFFDVSADRGSRRYRRFREG